MDFIIFLPWRNDFLIYRLRMYADSPEFVVLQFLLPGLAASYFASVACRFALSRPHLLRWRLGFLSTFAAAVAIVCLVWFGLSLKPGEDSYGMGRFLLFVCIAGRLLSVIPAEVVVWRYRKAYRGVDR